MDYPFNQRRNPVSLSNRGFTLVEMLAVMAIIIILLSLLAPLINSFTSTAGRKGAINIIMNTFEQARATALSTGANVYVVLRKRQFPERDCLMVVREAAKWNPKETGLIPLTRWISLPKGVLLYDPPKVARNLFKGGMPSNFNVGALPNGQSLQATDLAFLEFGPTGTIQFPQKDDCKLMVGEGVRGADGVAALTNPNRDSGLFDIIALRRFTGRASLDVSTLAGL